jgi:hypothetical protein
MSRYVITSLLLLGLAPVCRGQSAPEETRTFIGWFTASSHLGAATLLVDSTSFGVMNEEMEKVIRDSADFSREERQEIRKEVAEPAFHIWDTSLTGPLRILPSDSLKAVFKRHHSRDGWEAFYQRYGKQYCTFSAPIFLRKYTLCIFYAGQSCGWLCGGGMLAVYRKVDGQWQYWKNFGSWES